MFSTLISNSGIWGLPDCKHVYWSEGSTELTPYLNSGVFHIVINCRFHVNASAQEHIRLDLQKRVWVDPWELGCAEHSRWILFGKLTRNNETILLSPLKGPTASELLLYMRSSGWLSLSTDLQVIGLPRYCLVESDFAELIIICYIFRYWLIIRHGVISQSNPTDLRSLTSEEEGKLKKIKKAPHSPISLMYIESSNTSLASSLSSLIAKVAEQAPSIVAIRSLV